MKWFFLFYQFGLCSADRSIVALESHRNCNCASAQIVATATRVYMRIMCEYFPLNHTMLVIWISITFDLKNIFNVSVSYFFSTALLCIAIGPSAGMWTHLFVAWISSPVFLFLTRNWGTEQEYHHQLNVYIVCIK